MGKGQNEGGFSEEQIQMYKDCFKLMDINKDGQLDKNDLRGAFDNVGVLMSESELDGLLGEISGPCTYDNMVKMFQEKMAGEGNDPDDLIVQAFKAYDNEGKIDSKMFEHALKTWGDKMTKAEIDDIFGEVNPDERNLLSVAFKNLISSKRAACRTISAIEQNPKYSKFNGALLAYKGQIETQLQQDCQKIIDMINSRVLETSCSDEAKAFFVKMVGDYYRYIAENAKDQMLEDVKQKARQAYE